MKAPIKLWFDKLTFSNLQGKPLFKAKEVRFGGKSFFDKTGEPTGPLLSLGLADAGTPIDLLDPVNSLPTGLQIIGHQITIVPEPTTAAAAGVALLVLVAAMKRRTDA